MKKVLTQLKINLFLFKLNRNFLNLRGYAKWTLTLLHVNLLTEPTIFFFHGQYF